MTREERKKAIEVLDDMKVKIDIPKAAKTQNDRNWALDVAIQALSQKPCEKCEVGNPCLYCAHEFKDKRVEQMCKDCTHAGVYGANSTKCTLRDEIVFNDGRCNSFKPKVAQPCDDAISREAVLSLWGLRLSDKEIYMAIWLYTICHPSHHIRSQVSVMMR